MSRKLRRKKLIQRSMQLKLTATLISISALATMFQIFLYNRAILMIASQMEDADARLLKELPKVLQTNVAWTLAIMIPLMFYAGIVLTHRIAGPAYRMETYLRGIANGTDDGKPCRIRKADELQSLCDAVNAAVGKLRPEGSEQASEGAQEMPEPEGLVPAEVERESAPEVETA